MTIKLKNEIKYLQIAIDKTAGEFELEAWTWLIEYINNYKENIKKMSKVLGSIKDLSEAKLLLKTDIDIIDLKDPSKRCFRKIK